VWDRKLLYLKVEGAGAKSFGVGTRKTAYRKSCHERLPEVAPPLPYGGVGSPTSMSQHAWRLALVTPKPPGTDTAVLPV
jgi:hypothetical protein